MSEVNFQVPFDPDPANLSNFWRESLPIEVRKSNMVLVHRTAVSETIELEPGLYLFSARLPSGQELSATVQVPDEERTTVALNPESMPEPPFRVSFMPRMIRSLGGLRDIGVRMFGPAAVPPVYLRLFAGNTFGGEIRERPVGLIAGGSGKASVEIPGDDQVQYLQFSEPSTAPINVAVPAWGPDSCTFVISLDADRQGHIEAHVSHKQASLLLQYSKSGLLEQARDTSFSRHLQAEQLLRDKESHPIAATIGAYALLRFNELDRLHNWTENLMNWFPVLPDGAVIRGEHLARLGQHTAAFQCFLQLRQRGLPIFRDGVSLALDRLRLYARQKTRFGPDNVALATGILREFETYAAFFDFNKSVSFFTGLNPSHPGSETLGHELKKGLNIGEFLEASAERTVTSPAPTISA